MSKLAILVKFRGEKVPFCLYHAGTIGHSSVNVIFYLKCLNGYTYYVDHDLDPITTPNVQVTKCRIPNSAEARMR